MKTSMSVGVKEHVIQLSIKHAVLLGINAGR